jgi:putative Mg2+ transporter-C (MgtC) family protein
MSGWQTVVDGVWEEFTDLGPADQGVRLGVRLLLAAAVGGLLGWQRQRAGKPAGMRTHMVVALGSAFFLAVPQLAGLSLDGLSRVLQGLIAGVGFLGAGTILKVGEQGQVKGLTSAAGLWLTAALGAAVGMGRGASAVVCAALAFVILEVIGRLEHWYHWWDEDRHAVSTSVPRTALEGQTMPKPGQPPDDPSSAPESGTVRDPTSGNQPSDRGLNPGQGSLRGQQDKDDPSISSEER